MSYNAEKWLLTELVNAADEWYDDDMPLEVISLAQDAEIPDEIIQHAVENSDVDFTRYE